MTKSISILIFLSLFGLNAYIYLNTEKKIQTYAKSPPFRADDFTRSNRKNKFSNIKNLIDKDITTFWIKEQGSQKPDYDLELELTLTHTYKEKKFVKKEFHSLTFYSCLVKENYSPLRSPNKMTVDLFLREAINIDKELRLPKDIKITSFDLNFKNADFQKIDLTNLIPLQDSNTYPENIFILTLFIKDNSIYKENEKTCLAEIKVE